MSTDRFMQALELVKAEYADRCDKEPDAAERMIHLLNVLAKRPEDFWDSYFNDDRASVMKKRLQEFTDLGAPMPFNMQN